MIPDIVPVNNWQGNSYATEFDFDFLINSESELKVLHINKNAEQTELKLNIDYTISKTGDKNGGYITFPIQGSTYSVLSEKETITLMLNIPIAQTTPFGTSAVLNLSSLEYALDYIVRLIQILSRRVDRSVKANEGSEIDTDDVVNNLDKLKNSLYQYVEQSASEAEKATQQAQLAKEYAMQVEYGVRWQAFTADNWVSSDNKFTMTLDETSLIILGIYRVIDGIKEKVVNVDVSVAENKVTLTSPEAFTGGFLAVSKTQGNYTHQQTLPADEWLISHNLGKYPVVVIADNEGFVQMGTIQYLSLNQVRVTFENEISGFAYLS